MNYGFKAWEDVVDEHRKYSREVEEEEMGRALDVEEDVIDLPLRTVRKMAHMTQAEVAEALDSEQPAISKIESSTDIMLSTLRDYVKAIGGELEVLIHIEGKTVRLSEL